MARIFRAFDILIAYGLIPYGLFAQAPASPPAPPSGFTIASIKPNKSDDDRFMLRPLPGGGLTATGVTLKMLIMNAYQVAAYQILGAPSWIGSERWDIEAKSEGVQGRLSPDQWTALLRRLIEDRFQLKSRCETKKMPVYALVVTKSGSKLQPHPANSEVKPTDLFGRGSATFTNMPVADLTKQLSLNLGRPVLDRTGLKGGYDFKLEWTPELGEGVPAAFGLAPRAEPPPAADSNGPSIFAALQEQLGLKLESTKGPVDILMIDHVERPSEN
jgi:bla regulator protein blaR1